MITVIPSARARSVAIVSSSAARVWITSGLSTSRASSICAWKARSWSARGVVSRKKSSPVSPIARHFGCAARARSCVSAASSNPDAMFG